MKTCPNCKNSTMNFMKKCPVCKTELDDSCITTFGNALINQAKDIADAKAEKQQTIRQNKIEEKTRIQQMDKDGVAYCPKCHSTSISANKRGFGFGKSVVGAALAPTAAVPVGILAGSIGANKIEITCLKCGHKWKPGQT